MSHARRDEILTRYGLPPGKHPDYEIDHLIPLCLGGSDDPSNLWPEPRRSIEPKWNAEAKDREGDQPETAAIRLQMESLSGKIYFASLTVEAARNMVLGLSNWQPVQDFLSERGSRPKISDLELPD